MTDAPHASSPTAGPPTTVPAKAGPGQWTHRRDPDIVPIGGVDVAVRRDGAGVPVVFLHDVWFLRQWLPIHAALARDVDLIAPEAPGFGDSAEDTRFEDFTDAVLHLDSVLRHLDVGAVHLVGVGFGARLAAHVAATLPDRVSTLTLVAPTGLRVGDEPLPDPFRIAVDDLYPRLFNGRQDAHRDAFVLKGFPDDQVDLYADSKGHALFAWTQRVDHRLERRAYRIAAPTLVVAAGDDRIAPRTAADRYAALLPHARHVVLPGPDGAESSHALHIEQPDELAALVVAHIRGTEGEDRA